MKASGSVTSSLAPHLLPLTAATVLVACMAGAAGAAQIVLPGERAFPENLTSTRDGTLYVSSIAEGGIWRAAADATIAESWVPPGADGTRSTFGLLADEDAGLLWVCSADASGWGIPGPGSATGSALKAFDLTTGQLKASAALPGEAAACNDIAIAPDGSVYVSDVVGSRVLKLKAERNGFDVWAVDERFTPPPDNGGVDGLTFGEDGALYLNTFGKGQLFRVAVTKDGAAGEITELRPSRPLVLPDGMRAYGAGRFLMVEGGGTLDLVTIAGDNARIETLKDGLAGPVGVTQVGDTAWVAEGQLGYLFDPALKDQKPSLPFRIVGVPLAPR